MLTEEIANRYYYQEGRILAQMQSDFQLDKALKIINEPGTLDQVLAGKEGALAIQGTKGNNRISVLPASSAPPPGQQ